MSDPRRWYNPRLPQTLVISQFLLYLNGAFALLDTLFLRDGASSFVRLLYAGAVVAYVYGAYGIANEQRMGWRVAVAASFSPFIIRFVEIASVPAIFGISMTDKLRYTFALSGGQILSLIFDVALIALLLHQQSREHQKVWFS